MKGDALRPPRLLRAAISASLPAVDREDLLDELDALYVDRAARSGRWTARRWYAAQTAGFVVRVAGDRLSLAVGSAESYAQDGRLACRYFRRRPTFALATILTLGLGTSVLATVYAAAQWLLLRDVPGVSRPETLMSMRLMPADTPHVTWSISHPDLLTLRERLPVDGALAASTMVGIDLLLPDAEPRRATGELVTANYFEVLGHTLSAGRWFTPEEELRPSAVPGVIVSDAVARSLGGDPASALGRDVRVNGSLARIIGVAGPGFRGAELPGRSDLWLAAASMTLADPTASVADLAKRGEPVWRRMILRAPDGSTVDGLTASANAIRESIRQEFRAQSFMANIAVLRVYPGVGLDPAVRKTVRRALSLLGGAAVFLLILTMANLANIGLIESSSRTVPTAVRVALGATPARLARSVLVEILLLTLAASAVGLLLATLWTRWFQDAQLSEYGAPLAGTHIDVRVTMAALLVTALVAVAALFKPGLDARKRGLEALLRRGRAGSRAGARLRTALVCVQVALSVVLLIGAGLLTGSARNLRRIDLGFDPSRLLMFSVSPHVHGLEGEPLDRLARDIESRLVQTTSAQAAAFISPAPLRSGYVTASLYGDDPNAQPVIGAGYYVTPGFLRTLGARVVAGDDDWRAEKGTIVITRGALAKVYPGVTPEQAIGRMVPTRRDRKTLVRIAAIIEDVRLSSITGELPPSYFRPLAERPAGLTLAGFAAAPGSPASLADGVRRTVQEHRRDLAVFDVRTARAAVDLQFATLNAMAQVASTLSVIAVALAAVGLYAVLASAMAERRREIAIRAALGAGPKRLIRRVLASAGVPLVIGAVVGGLGAVWVAGLLSHELVGVGLSDPSAYGGPLLLLLSVAAIASGIPAYRAGRVAPAEVLRDETVGS